MSRWKAAAIHLAISAGIGVLAAILIFGVWYPSPYGRAAGATTLIALLLGVDVVLGPVLTLVVFRAGKKGLAFDLAVIAIAQVCALAYGMWVVWQARPVFIVGAIDRFVLVAANELDAADLAQSRDPQFRTLPWTGPRLVGAVLPTDTASRNQLLFAGINGKDIERFPQYFVPYQQVVSGLLERAQTLDELRNRHPGYAAAIYDWLRSYDGDKDRIVWLPLKARSESLTLLLDRRTGAVIDALPFDPW